MREIEVETLMVDPANNTPVLLLKEQDSGYIVPVWIGDGEATSIALELQGEKFPRPLTHDLIKTVMQSSGSQLQRVVIDDVDESTYFAKIVFEDFQGQIFEVDARPSDSVALAIRMDAPLFITEKVFQNAAVDISFLDLELQGLNDDGSTLELEELEELAEEDEFERFVEEEIRLSDFKKFL